MNVETETGANFSSLGMPGTSNLFTIDGLSQNDNGFGVPMSGASLLLLGQNQIQEATVVSIGYSGQFGGAASERTATCTPSNESGSSDLRWRETLKHTLNW